MVDVNPVISRRRPRNRIKKTITVDLSAAMRKAKTPEARALLKAARERVVAAARIEAGA